MKKLIYSAVSLAAMSLTACGNDASFISRSESTQKRPQNQNSGDANGLPGQADGQPSAADRIPANSDELADNTGDDQSSTTNPDANANGNADGNSINPAGAPVDVTPATVAQLCKSANVMVVQRALSYEPRKDCNWGSIVNIAGVPTQVPNNGNLSILNGFIRARESQVQTVKMPDKAVICGIDLKSKTNNIQFDDFFSFNLNDTVLASSKVIANALTADEHGLKTWKWEDIVGKPMQDIGKYCATGICELPEHDKSGKLEIGFALKKGDNPAASEDPAMMQQAATNAALFAKISNATDLNFTAIATGDNDDDDCFHSGGEFDLAISYVIQAP